MEEKTYIIIYYNSGKAISSAQLYQPPDLLTDEFLREALKTVLRMHGISKQYATKPDNPYVQITQDNKQIRTVHLTQPP